MDNLSGQSIKGYDLRERIGTGGFGAVYKAQQTTINREVAIKIILPHFSNHPDFIRRFENEAQLVARLEHLHIVPLYDYWRDPDGAYLVMRWLRGGSLKDALQKGPFTPDLAVVIIDQLASALATAHRNSVIHRDLKPGNILLDEDGNAYLADFGIAKDISVKGSITEPDAIIGSPDYLAPEQARGEIVTPATDIYSLGVVLYELLVGEHPFPNLSSVERLYKHLNDSLPLISNLPNDVSAAVNEVIQKATAKNPANRYSNVIDFAVAFRTAVRKSNSENVVATLTLREQDILRLIINGRSNKEIAEELFIALNTVKWYATQIYQKLGVRTRVQAIVRARELNLINNHEGSVLPDIKTVIPTDEFQPANPYKGLRPFQSADNRDFFGREKLIEKMLRRMAEVSPQRITSAQPTEMGRFLAVVGPSGSGKSSLVKAGLIPALWRGDLPGSEKWFVVEMVPSSHPLDKLEVALTRVAANLSANLREQLERDERGLVRAAQLILPNDGTELVLIIDQFEEVFTLVDSEQERVQFLKLIQDAVNDSRSRIRIVVTLRADFYDRPLSYPGIGELFRSQIETILPLTADGLEQAISQPAEQVGVHFEPGLVARIISDVNYQPGALPLLQYALTELFELRKGRMLTLDAYQSIGGTVGALAQRVDELYLSMTESAQDIAKQMFMRLVTLGEGVEDTRRRVARSELLMLTTEPDVMDEIIDTYAEYRLLSLDNEPNTRSPTVELAHEAILREWERLREWLNASRGDIRLLRQLALAATEWDDAVQDKSFLLRGSRLESFDDWVKSSSLILTPAEQAFLNTSRAEHQRDIQIEMERQDREATLEKRSVRFLRALAGVLSLAAFIAIALSLIALNENRIAQEAREVSNQNAQIAKDNAKYASSIALASAANSAQLLNNPDQAITLALASNSVSANSPAFSQSILYNVAFMPSTRRVYTDRPADYVRNSPDGEHAISWNTDNQIAYWTVSSGEILYEGSPSFLQNMKMGVINFATDGKSAYIQVSDNTTYVTYVIEFNVQNGEEIRRFALPDGAKRVLIGWEPVLSTHGHILVAGVDETDPTGNNLHTGQLYAWDTTTGKRVFEASTLPSGPSYNPFDLHFSVDDQTLVTVDHAGIAATWDAHTGEFQRTYGDSTNTENSIYWTFFVPDGILTIFGDITSYTTTVKLWDKTTGKLLQQTDWSSPLNWAALSHDGSTLALSFTASQIALLDTDTWTKTDLFGHTFSVVSVDFTADDRFLLSSSFDGTIRQWNLRDESEIQQIKGPASFLSSFVISPDGRTAAAQEYFQNEQGHLDLWDLKTGQFLRSLAQNEELMRSVAFSPDGKTIVSGSIPDSGACPGLGSTIHLTDVDTGKTIWESKKEVGSIFGGSAFTKDGRHILTVDWRCENFVTVWDAATGTKLGKWEGHHDGIWSISGSSDGKWFATGSQDNTAILWDAASGTVARTLTHQTPVVTVTFSPDSQYLLTAEQNGYLHLWDVGTGAEIRQFTRHNSSVIFMQFSPDGHYIVSSSGTDSNVFVWSVETGEVIRQWHIPTISPIGSVVAFNPDGQSIYMADDKNVIHQVNLMLKPHELMDWIVQNRYVRDLTCDERNLYRVEPLCQVSTS